MAAGVTAVDVAVDVGVGVGADLKGFLGEVKPALMTPIEAEFQKNPYEVSQTNPKSPPPPLLSAQQQRE